MFRLTTSSRATAAAAWLLLGASCSRPADASDTTTAPAAAQIVAEPAPSSTRSALTVHFYDVGQGLSVLVSLPDGRHILVDAGDRAHRPGCGDICAAADVHLVDQLRIDLAGAPIDMLFITHEHSDHIGGAPAVMGAFPTAAYVDNGLDGRKGEVRRAHRAAEEAHAVIRIVDPDHRDLPIPDAAGVKLTAVVPSVWPPACAHDANECSIGLRIDYGASSVLFTGDAEHEEESVLEPLGPATLLQVAHHGSETSTSPAFLFKVRPQYAVISAGKPGEGLNRTYCHPRASIVKRLTRVLGAATTTAVEAFDGERCGRATAADWISVAASDHLWATERDGDVVLTTTGDGVFRRVHSASPGGLSSVRP